MKLEEKKAKTRFSALVAGPNTRATNLLPNDGGNLRSQVLSPLTDGLGAEWYQS